MRTAGILLISCMCAHLFAQETPSELAKNVPIPSAYKGDVIETRDDDPKQKFRYRFAISFDWTEGMKYILDLDFGDTPLAYEYATDEESYSYSFGQSPQAIRDSRFQDTGMMSIEQFVSPLPILRILRSGNIDRVDYSIEKTGLLTVLELPRAGSSVINKLFFEDRTGYLVRQQTVGLNGKIVLERTFENWIPVGDSGEAPSRIRLTLPDDSGAPVSLTAIISNMEPLDPQSPPERINPRADATIIDLIEGVSKLADGTVLGEIIPESSPARAAGSASNTTNQKTRIIMLIGIGFILLAGIVVGLRRWKAA
jgi:hypothetical protein